jgi:outer membrane lipoprotein SlyB
MKLAFHNVFIHTLLNVYGRKIMEMTKTSNRIHPLVAGAAISVMLVSLIGVAAMTGLFPNSHGTVAPATELSATAPVAASAPAAPEPKVAMNNDAAVPAKSTAPAAKHHKIASRANAPSPTSSTQVASQAPAICDNCGMVESVQAIQHQGKPSGLGVVAGGVLGGLLGNQVGGGNGRTLATVAGAVGGGYAGNEVEKRTHTTTSYQVRVRMEGGTLRTFPYSAQPGWNTGDRVKVMNGTLTSQA